MKKAPVVMPGLFRVQVGASIANPGPRRRGCLDVHAGGRGACRFDIAIVWVFVLRCQAAFGPQTYEVIYAPSCPPSKLRLGRKGHED